MTLPQIFDSEWQRPVHRGYVCECCQCGLRHRMDFRVVADGRGKHVEFRAVRIKRRRRVMPV